MTNNPWGWMIASDVGDWVCPRCGWHTYDPPEPFHHCSNPFWRYDRERDEWHLVRARFRGWTWAGLEKQQREGGG